MFLVSLISILVLLSLGLLNARAFVSQKHDKLKDAVDKIAPYESYIGLAGIVLGVLGVLGSIGNLGNVGTSPLYFLLGLAGSLLSIALGALSAAAFIKQQVISGNANLSVKLDEFINKLLPLQQTLGLAAIGVSIFYLLVLVTH